MLRMIEVNEIKVDLRKQIQRYFFVSVLCKTYTIEKRLLGFIYIFFYQKGVKFRNCFNLFLYDLQNVYL